MRRLFLILAISFAVTSWILAIAQSAVASSGWSTPVTIAEGLHPTSVSCPSSSFCAVVDEDGRAAIYDSGSWGTFVSVGGRFHAVSCPSASFCVAGNDGRVAIYNGTSWTESNFIDTAPAGEHSFYAYTLTSVSCPSTSFCATVDGWGKALTYDGTSWNAPVNIDGETWLTSVSCTSSSFCAAVDQRGNALTYNGSSWSGPSSIDSGHELTSVSCPSAAFCATVDYAGHILTFHATPPSNTSAPSISGTPIRGDTLVALHGIWTDDPTSYSYQWQLCNPSGGNCGAIPGATASSYTLAEQDVGQTIRVQESAANIVGTSEPVVSSATRVVAKPPRGIGQAEVGRATTRGLTATVPVRCTGASGAGCQIALAMRLGVKLKNGNRALRRAAKVKAGTLRRTVIVAKKTVQLNAGHRRLVCIRLNGAGRQLLKARHRLSVRFRATQTANGAMAAVSIQKLTFRTRTHSKRKKGRTGNG